MVLLNHLFPCFHFFSKTNPSQLHKLCHKVFFVEGANEILLNSHICRFPISGYKQFKRPNLKKSVINYQKLMFQNILICITYCEKL